MYGRDAKASLKKIATQATAHAKNDLYITMTGHGIAFSAFLAPFMGSPLRVFSLKILLAEYIVLCAFPAA
jgi:hypothetical protein